MKTKAAALSPVAEIAQLHGAIIAAARDSLSKAIRVGELLAERKAKLKHGEWLPWIAANLPFSQPTAFRYMRCYDRRDEIKSFTLNNLTDAYKLLAAPQPGAIQYESKLIKSTMIKQIKAAIAVAPTYLKHSKDDQVKRDQIEFKTANSTFVAWNSKDDLENLLRRFQSLPVTVATRPRKFTMPKPCFEKWPVGAFHKMLRNELRTTGKYWLARMEALQELNAVELEEIQQLAFATKKIMHRLYLKCCELITDKEAAQ